MIHDPKVFCETDHSDFSGSDIRDSLSGQKTEKEHEFEEIETEIGSGDLVFAFFGIAQS